MRATRTLGTNGASTQHSEGLGQAAAIATAVASIASTTIPMFVGESPQERRRKQIKARRGAQRLQKEVAADADKIERVASSWSSDQVETILSSNARMIYERHKAKYAQIAANAGVPGANQLAERAAEVIRSKALSAAETRRAWLTIENHPGMVAGSLAGVLGASILAYQRYKD